MIEQNKHRNSRRKYYIGFVFAYVGFIHLAQHMDYSKGKELSGTEARYEPTVQQHIGLTRSKGILLDIAST